MSSDMQHSVTAADIEAKKQAWQAGYQHGQKMADKIVEPDRGLAIDYPEPYLQHLYLTGVGQALANKGRDIAGLSSHRPTNDTEGKERK
jgi:hypothetical protein